MVLGLHNKKLILITFIFLCSCQNTSKQFTESLFVSMKTKQDNAIGFKIKVIGPVENMYWGNQLFMTDYSYREFSTLKDFEIKNLQNHPILVIENRKGDIRVFSDYIKNIEYPYSDHGTLVIEEFIFSVEEGKSKTISFKTPFESNHFFIRKGKEEKEIRLHYVLLSEKDGIPKNILYTSNWISLPVPQ